LLRTAAGQWWKVQAIRSCWCTMRTGLLVTITQFVQHSSTKALAVHGHAYGARCPAALAAAAGASTVSATHVSTRPSPASTPPFFPSSRSMQTSLDQSLATTLRQWSHLARGSSLAESNSHMWHRKLPMHRPRLLAVCRLVLGTKAKSEQGLHASLAESQQSALQSQAHWIQQCQCMSIPTSPLTASTHFASHLLLHPAQWNPFGPAVSWQAALGATYPLLPKGRPTHMLRSTLISCRLGFSRTLETRTSCSSSAQKSCFRMASLSACLRVDMPTPMATHGCFPTTVVTLPPMGQGGSPI
jgi:hypothetical protein